MNTLTKEQSDKLAKARYQLYRKQPFLWHLVHYLKMKPVTNIPTMGVDIHGNLYTNMEFFDACNVQDLTWVLAHEVMHLVTTTHKRLPTGASMRLWNIASDISINQIITDAAGFPIITTTMKDEQIKPWYGEVDLGQHGKLDLTQYKGWTTEKIYYDLMEKLPKCANGNAHSGDGDSPQDKDGDLSDLWWDDSGSAIAKETDKNQEAAQQWRQRVASAKAAGKVTGDLEAFLADLLQPQRDWRKELRQLTHSALRRKRTWLNPGRRTIGMGIRTPSKNRLMETCVCYIDTSGSMSNDIIQVCVSEVASICSVIGAKLRLILGDCEIYYDGEVAVADLKDLQLKRGGTDFTVLFDHIAESEKDQPKLLIGFTDAYGPFPKNAPDYPVIWTLLKGQSATPPWGHVIDIDV